MKLKSQKMKTRLSYSDPKAECFGWLDGRHTYLGVKIPNSFICWLDGKRLYRLAKAIVRQFEGDKQ